MSETAFIVKKYNWFPFKDLWKEPSEATYTSESLWPSLFSIDTNRTEQTFYIGKKIDASQNYITLLIHFLNVLYQTHLFTQASLCIALNLFFMHLPEKPRRKKWMSGLINLKCCGLHKVFISGSKFLYTVYSSYLKCCHLWTLCKWFARIVTVYCKSRLILRFYIHPHASK